MPEGHLIHRLAADHRTMFGGQQVHLSSPQGRFLEAEQVSRRVLLDVDAYGKHLFYVFGSDAVIHIHLGQTGRFVIDAGGPIAWARLRIEAAGRVAQLIAPSQCRLITAADKIDVIGRLGPDPLRGDADPAPALERIAASSAPIGSLLLDQSVIAGVGNVLRAEILFLLGVDPDTPGASLGMPTLTRLWRETVRVMSRARERGRIVTRESPAGEGSTAAAAERQGRFVYRQERCGRCGSDVRVWTLGGRTAYACPRCQAA